MGQGFKVMKIILKVCLSLSIFCTVNTAHAIDAKYRERLEISGCTQVSEMQGCDTNKTKAENTKAGFVTDAAVDISTHRLSTTPAALTDLVGVKASIGKPKLLTRGYTYIRTDNAGERSWDYWYNPTTNSCVTIALYDELYNAITDTPYDCDGVKHNQK